MKNILIIFNLVILCLGQSLISKAQMVRYDEVADGFNAPVDLQFSDDGRAFVVEQVGMIRIIDNGMVLNDPFLDLTDVTVRSGEQGLLGMALHPLFSDNGYFYVNYIDANGNTIVSRFSTSSDPNIADRNSEKLILNIVQPYSNHNGGCIQFGPDGYLYIGMGDGGSGGDPDGYGQLRTTLLGKMLRIDVNTDEPYVIPVDNPFADDDFTMDEIWALGLRNPWRFSFDSETGDLWIGDVGQNLYEEIDMQLGSSAGGENYGWRCKEASEPFNLNNCPDESEFTDPVLTIEQGPDCSVTGGYVYRGSDIPLLDGIYIFGDFCSGRVYTLTENSGIWESERLPDVNNPSAFGQDKNGEMYIVSYSGQIYKIANIISGINNINADNLEIGVSPNPTTDNFTLTMNDAEGSADQSTKVYIFNAVGEIIYKSKWSNSNSMTLSSKNWPDGIYTARIVNRAGSGSAMFLKVN